MESILNSIKKLLGIDAEETCFDADVIMHINSVLMILNQLGVGTPRPFTITGAEETWADFLGAQADYNMVKTYVYARVRLVFDPPSTSYLITSLADLAREYEYRLTLQSMADEKESEVKNE